MPQLEVRPFAAEDLDAAAGLLAKRHQRHRQAEPLLAEAIDFRAEVGALWEKDGVSGTVALRDGRLVGYLLGARRDDSSWGPNVWVEAAGHAVEEAEDVRDLYAAVAEGWVANGRTRHYALVPATDAALVDAWFRLGFGAQHAHGIREVPDGAEVAPPPGVEIRGGREEDAEASEPLGTALNQYQSASPVFSQFRVEGAEEHREEWLAEVADPDAALLVAERAGRLVGLFTAAPVEYSSAHESLARPERASILGYAAVLPDERGTGLGVALTEAVFAWSRERGYRTIVVDWRVTNLLASRFWARRGFRTTFLRLYRSIP